MNIITQNYSKQIHLSSSNELDDINIENIKDSDTIDLLLLSANNYPKILEFVLKLDQSGKKCNVVIDCEINNRNEFNNVFLNYNFKNVKLVVYSDSCYYTFKSYIKEEKLLNNLVLPIKKQNLSPLEKYLAVYNIVKNYKPYKIYEKHEKDFRKSACLKYILKNEYIVCTGFTTLLVTLCDRGGIKVNEIGVDIDEKKGDGVLHHSRCIVSIDDDKYNVHGLYMADPTWDNDSEVNSFNHALMTFDKMQVSQDRFYYNFYEPIIDIHNFEDFNEQFNYLLNNQLSEYRLLSYNFNYYLKISYASVLSSILDTISSDPKYKYFYDMLDKCKEEKDYINLITELGNYLLTRINKKIDNKTLFTAIINSKVIDVGYDEKTIQFFLNYYMLDKYFFPYRVDNKRNHRLIKRRTIDV